ncbi:MAG: HAMP domain-containing histidine kinase [Oscillospiraceae bacterium]|nr:HAMP domain-containing histidine kinase [Oscillospiraceae bacterium]
MTTSTREKQAKNKAPAAKPADPNKRAPTLRSTIWLYFSVFTAVILILIWLFQVVSLSDYYEVSKKRKIIRSAAQIAANFDADDPDSVDTLLEELAYDNGMAIIITDWAGNVVAQSDYMGSSILTSSTSYLLFQYRNDLLSSDSQKIIITNNNERFGTTELIYGEVLEKPAVGSSGYLLFINASLEPITSTVDIIKEQFVIIALVTFFIALIITLMLSSRLSRPFTNITALAHRLAAGDYTVRFPEGSYAEVNELAETLNYAASEMSKTEELRNDLIANVSHDLRTPLTMIKAYAEMIRDLSGDNPEKREEHLSVIIEETDRLSLLVSSLMELSKLQSGSSNINRTEFSSKDFLDEILSKYQIFSEKQGYEFVFEEDEDVRLWGDQQKLSQVMYNFINNAVNYSGDSRRIIIRQINQEDSVRIEVQDFGVGIEKDKLPKVFDRYYRGERTKRDVVGTGLGLSIVKEILELHGYRFGVMSELGKGSTFWFEIKRAEVPKLPPKTESKKPEEKPKEPRRPRDDKSEKPEKSEPRAGENEESTDTGKND